MGNISYLICGYQVIAVLKNEYEYIKL